MYLKNVGHVGHLPRIITYVSW